jgi:hypothetical protein
MRKARVGITIGPDPDAGIWSSGLNQNLFHLVRLLAASPLVEKVVLLNMGEQATVTGEGLLEGLDVAVVKPSDVTHDIDLAIEMGSSLPQEWVRHVTALGARVITMLVGHTYQAQAEDPVFNRPTGLVFIGTRWEEVWVLPHHEKTAAPLLRTVTRAPVVTVPHIWSPYFIDKQAKEAAAAGRPFGFKPNQQAGKAWRCAIFEPKMSVVKSCFIPMLVCDSAYRDNRDAVELMMVLNSFHMKEHGTFQSFALSLDLTKDGKASYEPRVAFVHFMTEHRIDAVVAHHWECGLNYSYYDALHGGYPLVHNSEYLRDAGLGFYYDGFDAISGGRALLDAWGRDAGYWEDYRARARRWLAKLDPVDKGNVEIYTAHIARLLGDRLGQA